MSGLRGSIFGTAVAGLVALATSASSQTPRGPNSYACLDTTGRATLGEGAFTRTDAKSGTIETISKDGKQHIFTNAKGETSVLVKHSDQVAGLAGLSADGELTVVSVGTRDAELGKNLAEEAAATLIQLETNKKSFRYPDCRL